MTVTPIRIIALIVLLGAVAIFLGILPLDAHSVGVLIGLLAAAILL